MYIEIEVFIGKQFHTTVLVQDLIVMCDHEVTNCLFSRVF